MRKQHNNGVIKLEDVAALAGVAKSTVSRVLSGETTLNIREDTRKKIIESANSLGYRPDARARALRTKRSRTLGILVDEFDNPSFSTIIRGAQRAAIKRGYSIFISFTDTSFPDAELYRRLIDDVHVDGILVSTVTDPALIVNLSSSGKPLLLINRQVNGLKNAILLDYEKGTKQAVEHLMSLGHKHIAFVSGPLENYTGQTRLKGYRSAFVGANLPIDEKMVAACNYNWEEAGRVFEALLKNTDLLPTAVCAANVVVASGIIAMARKLGLNVPKDISVIALTDSPMAEMHVPTISALNFPFLELGIESANTLIDIIEGKGCKSENRSLEALEIIQRGSADVAPQLGTGLRLS